MHIISRKFMLVVNSILFRDNVTFQMAISLGFLFISFCLHITFWPFLGMKERAEIIREEAEANIFLEIQKLEKASRVIKISGKVSSGPHNMDIIYRVPLLRFCRFVLHVYFPFSLSTTAFLLSPGNTSHTHHD